jgi:site-specific DNA-methyltransferase (adenine-specific)
LSHTLECKPIGVKRVKSQSGGPCKEKEGLKPHNVYGDRQYSHFEQYHNDGYETVEAWECSEYCPVAILDKQSGISTDRDGKHHYAPSWFGVMKPIDSKIVRKGETGGASRYFAQFRPDAPFVYAPKASRRERNAGCEALPEQSPSQWGSIQAYSSNPPASNHHPTVKSLSLMKYLIRLITPPNGVVLDCFAGSGSTLVAAIPEGFHYIGIEQEQEYIDIINCRIAHAISEKNKEKIA